MKSLWVAWCTYQYHSSVHTFVSMAGVSRRSISYSHSKFWQSTGRWRNARCILYAPPKEGFRQRKVRGARWPSEKAASANQFSSKLSILQVTVHKCEGSPARWYCMPWGPSSPKVAMKNSSKLSTYTTPTTLFHEQEMHEQFLFAKRKKMPWIWDSPLLLQSLPADYAPPPNYRFISLNFLWYATAFLSSQCDTWHC